MCKTKFGNSGFNSLSELVLQMYKQLDIHRDGYIC